MIVLRMAGKILLLPVWLLLATAHLLVKIAVEIYCIGKWEHFLSQYIGKSDKLPSIAET